MYKILFLQICALFLFLGQAPHVCSATTAHASIDSETYAGKYQVSGMTDEERKWFITFLKGNLFADGWEQISSDILVSAHPEERDLMKTKLHELGFKIGSEWCKDNDSRKIDTPMLKKWGKDLREAANDTPHLLAEVLHRIHTEVNQLLN